MLKIQYVDKEIPLSTRDSGNQNFIKLRNSGDILTTFIVFRNFTGKDIFISCLRVSASPSVHYTDQEIQDQHSYMNQALSYATRFCGLFYQIWTYDHVCLAFHDGTLRQV